MNDILIMIMHIFTPIILAFIVNGIIYINGWNKNNNNNNKLLPPGYVIAIIWVLILGILGYTHYLSYPSTESWIIVFAILYCLAYPFLTSGLKNSEKTNVFNIIALIISIIVFISVFLRNKLTSLFILPFLLWCMYVNIVTNL